MFHPFGLQHTYFLFAFFRCCAIVLTHKKNDKMSFKNEGNLM